MNQLPLELENIIKDYKAEMEHRDIFKYVMQDIKELTRKHEIIGNRYTMQIGIIKRYNICLECGNFIHTITNCNVYKTINKYVCRVNCVCTIDNLMRYYN